MPAGALQHRIHRVLLTLAAVDWLLAFGMTAADVRRQVSVPLLVTAAAVLVASQRRWLVELLGDVRTASDQDVSRWSVAEAAIARQWSPRVARLALHEPRLLWSIILLLRGRRDGRAAKTFSYHREALPVWVVLTGVTLLEVALTPLFPLPAVAHWLLLAAGAWTLVVVVGLIAALVVHPHLVTAQKVRLRSGWWDEVTIPRGAVVEVRATSTATSPRGLRVAGGEATLSPHGVTNMVMKLATPVPVRDELVTTIRFWVDVPGAFLGALERT